MMRVLFLGDIVGEPGRLALYRSAHGLKTQYELDALIVNGENAAGGRGITPAIAHEFFSKGIDVITLGDHSWDQTDIVPWIDGQERVLRPLNHQAGTPGHGSCLLPTAHGLLGILCLQGRTFMKVGLENPFTRASEEVHRLHDAGAAAIIVDFHAETTSEKVAMGHHLDGRVSAVIGTHTHVQTNDASILPGGTAYLTDAGMCGPLHSIIGRDIDMVLQSFVTCMPRKFPVAGWPARLSGALLSIDESTGKATSITPINTILEK